MADMRYAAAQAALRVLADEAAVDLGKDDIEFLKGPRLWLRADRGRVRRCIEAYAYGGLDVIGLPRFPLPAEFVACTIATQVHPSNWMTACVVMEGAEWTENVILNREDPLSAEVLFSHVLRIGGGELEDVHDVEKRKRRVTPAAEQAAAE